MTLLTGLVDLEVTAADITQHPFILSLGGLVFWFTLKYSIQKNKKKVKGFKDFWKQMFDEILLSAIGALCFIVFDDELMHLINLYLDKEVPVQMHNAFYLLSGPISDKLYKVFV